MDNNLILLLEQEYDNSLKPLLIDLLEFVSKLKPVKQTDKGSVFKEKCRRFLLNYVYNPIGNASALYKNSSLVNDKKMIYNRIFQSKFEDQPIVTKTTSEFTSDIIHEIFLNMIILNHFLYTNILDKNIVPTLGFFFAPQVNDKKICVKTPDECFTGKIYMNMSQYYIPGEQLGQQLRKGTLSLLQLKKYIGQILSTLIVLNESPYKIRHNDLHTGNVLITSTCDVYIIDYGLSTFIYKGIIYKPSLDNTREADYFKNESYQHICALDMFSLFHNISNDTKELKNKNQKEINSYSNQMLFKFFYDKLWYTKTEHIPTKNIINLGPEYPDIKPGPIRNEPWLYILLRTIENQSTNPNELHQLNKKVLDVINYRWFLEQIAIHDSSYDINWLIINENIEKSKHIENQSYKKSKKLSPKIGQSPRPQSPKIGQSPKQPIKQLSPKKKQSPKQPIKRLSPKRKQSPKQPIKRLSPKRKQSPKQPIKRLSPKKPIKRLSPKRKQSPKQPIKRLSPKKKQSPKRKQ